VISLTQRPLPDKTQHSKERGIHAFGGIRTRNPNNLAARLRPRGHLDRLCHTLQVNILTAGAGRRWKL